MGVEVEEGGEGWLYVKQLSNKSLKEAANVFLSISPIFFYE